VKKRLAVLLAIATAFAISPAGWKWSGNAHAGWSWNAEIAAVDGDTVTLVSKRGSALTLTAAEGADPVEGDDVTVAEDTLIWAADDGGTVAQPLGWSWNGD
jgi:hypothetical protein